MFETIVLINDEKMTMTLIHFLNLGAFYAILSK